VQEIKRILVGSDLSAASRHTVAVGCALAHATGAEVDLLHAVDDRREVATGYALLDDLLHLAGDWARLRRGALEALRAEARECGPPEPKLLVERGDPVACLLEVRERQHSDLVVLGAGSLRGLRRFVLGSVADRVMRRPGAPLLLVAQPPEGARYGRILVGLELPDSIPPWLELGIALCTSLRSELIVLHVLPRPGRLSDSRHAELEPAEVPARIEANLARVAPLVPVRIEVRPGDPATEIPSAARALGADLVVLGAERHPDGWPGRVADRVARAGLPSVLLVWPPVTGA
jgi:nucleotide-binding universal stress UspA family protein